MTPSVPVQRPVTWSTLSINVFIGGLAAMTSGIIVLGLGSRIVMRMAALLDPGATGAVTEYGNIVGRITADGAIGLVVFIGLFGGAAGGAVWVIVRNWLPNALMARALLFGVLAMLGGGFIVIDADNRDFSMLAPALPSVGMFIALTGIWAVTTACLDAWMKARSPRPRWLGPISLCLVLIAGVVVIPLLVQTYLIPAPDSPEPPRYAGIMLLAAASLTVLRWRLDLREPRNRVSIGRWSQWLATLALAGLAVSGGAHLVGQIQHIVT